MIHPPLIPDESVLTRWIGMEIAKMNEGLVKERKTLAALLSENSPASLTRRGDPYYFDRAVIESLGRSIPEDLRQRLKLPILFYSSPDTQDSCSCPDTVALAVFQLLGEVSMLRTMQGDRFWVSRPIAYTIMKKYPSAVQIVMGV